MKIKIINHVPTEPSPKVGMVYDVVRIKERSRREGGNIYFVKCEHVEVGVLRHEMEEVKEEYNPDIPREQYCDVARFE